MEMKTITVKIKDPQRFEWGLREFYPHANVKLVALHSDNFAEYVITYQLKEHRDGVAGYVRGHRNW